MKSQLDKHSTSRAPTNPSVRTVPSPPATLIYIVMAGTAPPEFICPISGSLMADPVIVVPTGETFERGCIEACTALGFTPAALSPSLDLAASPPAMLIPNANLKKAIAGYCDRSGLPRPLPLSPDAAENIVRGLMAVKEAADATAAAVKNATPLYSVCTWRNNGRPFDSPPSSQEFTPPGVTQEEAILIKLLDDEPAGQEAALETMKQTLRDNKERRRALCTSRLLAGLRRLLCSRHGGVQLNAAACIINLSLEPANRVQIVRAEVVPVLVELLAGASPELRDHAAGAIYSLSIEEKNRIPIGVLGAIPPLLQLFASAVDGNRARLDAGMALYYLSLAEMNRSTLARTAGAMATMVAAAGEASLRRPAVMVMANLAGCVEGREALIDGGAVDVVVGLMRDGVKPGSTEEEYCLSALHGMSRGNVRFGGLARAAGAGLVLRRVAEGGGGGVRRDMAWRTLRAVSGSAGAGQYYEEATGWGADADDVDVSVMSEAMAMPQFPRRFGEHGMPVGPPRSNTTALERLREPPAYGS